ncbi:MAG: DeoR family transcriptional regulator, partial [Candidatus Gracilibacteria bacterium]|nr:DeoR family transcriptional regulator [Candidatus Gracilibacteria bacterium]
MDQRKTFILRAIVESFIETARPVGSRYLLSEHKLDVSPATIRNDMAYLEEMGLLMHPHTSAGRIPTDKGLRTFVDALVEEDLNFRVPAKLLKRLKELGEIKNE